jgi:hypothetical protein
MNQATAGREGGTFRRYCFSKEPKKMGLNYAEAPRSSGMLLGRVKFQKETR